MVTTYLRNSTFKTMTQIQEQNMSEQVFALTMVEMLLKMDNLSSTLTMDPSQSK